MTTCTLRYEYLQDFATWYTNLDKSVRFSLIAIVDDVVQFETDAPQVCMSTLITQPNAHVMVETFTVGLVPRERQVNDNNVDHYSRLTRELLDHNLACAAQKKESV